MSETSYSKLDSTIYRRRKAINQQAMPQKLCYSNGSVISAGVGGINIYDLLEQDQHNEANLVCKATNVSHGDLKVFNSVTTLPNGHFFTAGWSGKGLVEFPSNVNTPNTIFPGEFADVTSHNSHLYALDCNENKILVLKRQSDMWVDLEEIKLQNQFDPQINDRLHVTNDAIFISSLTEHCVFVYDLNGNLKLKTGESGSGEAGKLNMPYLCGVDDSGRALVADSINQRFVVCDTALDTNHDGERWKEVNIWPPDLPSTTSGQSMWPSHVSSTASGNAFRLPVHAVVINDLIIVADNARKELVLCQPK